MTFTSPSANPALPRGSVICKTQPTQKHSRFPACCLPPTSSSHDVGPLTRSLDPDTVLDPAVRLPPRFPRSPAPPRHVLLRLLVFCLQNASQLCIRLRPPPFYVSVVSSVRVRRSLRRVRPHPRALSYDRPLLILVSDGDLLNLVSDPVTLPAEILP